jgi:septal ring factor EnvC (AmiA/AmiB activator)
MKRLAGPGIALLIALCAAPALPAPRHNAKSQLKSVQQRIGALQKKMQSTEASRNAAADALKKSESAISDTNRRLMTLSRQENALHARLDDLQRQQDKTQGNIAREQAFLAKLLRQQYDNRRDDGFLRVLLSQHDPNQAARDAYYIGCIYRAHAELAASLHKNLATLDSITQLTREKQDELAHVKAEQTRQKQELLASQQERARVLDGLSRQIESQRKEISRLQQDEQRLTQLMERLEKQSRRKPPNAQARKNTPRDTPATTRLAEPDTHASPFQQYKGKLPLPVRGELAGRFGAPRDETGVPWKGLFIKAREGTPVKAVAPGKVVFADWMRGFGNLLIVDHGGGFMSLYGNAETLYKQVGESVQGGENIAAVGNSGGIPQSGLYFELRYQSRPVNPSNWLAHG